MISSLAFGGLLAVAALADPVDPRAPRIVAQAGAGLVLLRVVETCGDICTREALLQWRDASGKVLKAISVPELPDKASVESIVAEWGAGTPARFTLRLAKKGGTVTVEVMGRGEYRATGP